MSERESYQVEIAGIVRELPLFEVAPGVRIAIFNMLGDTLVIKAAAAALADRLRGATGRVLLTAEAKSIPLVFEMSALLGLPHVILRKSYKGYMGDAIAAESVSITTGRPQKLYLDEKDRSLINQHPVIIVDDVVSTGSTLSAMRQVVDAAGGQVTETVAVFTEGDEWTDVIALGNLPLFAD